MLKIYENGNRMWKNEGGELHRIDGPACEYIDGHKYWFVNGKRHRENGPAVEYSNGSRYWYISGLLNMRERTPSTPGPIEVYCP